MIHKRERDRRKMVQEPVEPAVLGHRVWELTLEEAEPHGWSGGPELGQFFFLYEEEQLVGRSIGRLVLHSV